MASPAELLDDRCFKNTFPDEIGDDKDQILNDEKKMLSSKYLLGAMENVMVQLQTWETGIAATDSRSDYSVYTGTSGYVMLYLRMYQQNKDRKYLTKATDLVERDLKRLKGRRVTFLTGDPGPLALAACLYKLNGQEDKSHKYISEILKFRQTILSADSGQEDEVLYGRAGYLYALLFLRQQQIGMELITEEVINEVMASLVSSGRVTAKKVGSTSPLMYFWHDKGYIGAAHGLMGILFMMLQGKDHLGPGELHGVVRGTVDYLCGLQQTSGNLPSSLSNTSDRLVHWCHGAPGAVFLFAKAYQVFEDEKYLNHAKRAGECVWRRGLLQKGYGLCHGASGNGYALLYLYQITGEVLYLYRAGQYGGWCQNYGTHGCSTPDRPLSLYEGLAGNIYFILDLLTPQEAKFPGFVL